ncbi:MAG: glycoside hydrolase family 2 protein, partial [Oscillibacter sp.]|nr:glycoside hydrolase family 2 protein [Oscillibacter sp.]
MEKQDFRGGWRFSADSGPSRLVTLPHDAMQERRRAPDAPSGSGCAYYLGGVYEYEKTFLAPEAWRNQTVLLEFEGVYPTAEVFVNGKSVGGCAYGYSLFRVELKGLQYGRENTVRVHVDGSRTPDSRWYSGAGVYRPVWLLVLPERHILPDGVRVTTLSHAPAEVRVETAAIGGGDIRVEILDGDQVVAQGDGADVTLPIPNGKLWSAEHPHLYRCRVTLLDRGAVLDERTVPFGIRTLSWSAGGFFVNGESVKLKGGCVHHDHGILGARSFP